MQTRASLETATPLRRIVVDRSQFCQLALSTKKLVRSDEPSAGLRGLLDPRSGELFVIDEQVLYAPAFQTP